MEVEPLPPMRYSNDSNIAALVRQLVDKGWKFSKGKKHGKLRAPNGNMLAVPCTPSDYRSHLNFKRNIKRISGLEAI